MERNGGAPSRNSDAFLKSVELLILRHHNRYNFIRTITGDER